MMLANVIKQLFASRRVQPVAEVLAAADAALAADDLVAAENALTTAIATHPDHVGTLCLSGNLNFKRGQFADALSAFRRAETLGPLTDDCYCLMAQCHYALGNISASQGYCDSVLKRNADHLGAHEVLAAIALPGPHYMDLLSAIHHSLKPATYLEVGVFQGRSIALARPPTSAIGVDPEPRILASLGDNVRIFAMTSDAFFSQHEPVKEFGGRRVDLAFIDGMHHFEFALRDFAHIERYCTTMSIVLVHDCFPLDRRTAERTRSTRFWSGDVWRMVVALKKYRPDLAIHTIGTRPTGLALIRNLDPDSRVLFDHMDEIVADLSATDYGVLDRNKRETLNWFPNDFEKIENLLHPTSSRS